VSRIRNQVDQLIIVDNASDGDGEWLRRLAASNQCELLLLDENVGIAAAHNAGIEAARAKGADAVLLLDQDSLPAPEMVHELRRALEELTKAGNKVAAVGPRQVDARTGAEAPFVRFGYIRNLHLVCGGEGSAGRLSCDHLITSGSLVPLASIDAVGKMDDRLFIDNVDTEWCLRALSKGYQLFGVCSAGMAHRVGDRLATVRIPRSREVVVHSPLRLYYTMRNRLLLYGRPYTTTKWKSQDLLRLLFKTVLFTAFIPPRRTNTAMIWKGLRDAMHGKTGRYAL
jgi:rhamnosyltransferase